MYTAARRASFLPFFNVYTLTALFLVFLAALYLLIQWDEDPTKVSRLYLLGLVQLTPFVICLTRRKFNYIAFIMVSHFVTYTVSTHNFVSNLDVLDTLPSSMLLAITENIRCTLLILAGYFVSRYFMFYSFTERLHYDFLSMPRVWFLGIALYVLLMPLYLYYIPAQILIVHFALVSADLVLLFSSTVREARLLSRVIRLGAFLSAFWYFINTGMLTMIGNYAGFYFVVSCLQKKYKNFLWVFAITIFASSVQTVKAEYRNFLKENHQNTSLIEKTTVLTELLAFNFFTDEGKESGEADEKIMEGFARAGDESLERVLSMTPSVVPFWKGQTYRSIPYMFIPRALWPGKPTRHFWHEFGIKYGYLSEDDNQTSVSVCFLAEGYMNFGFLGMYTVALLFGLMAALVERMSYFFLQGHFMFTFIVFLMPLLQYSSDLGSMINSLVVATAVMMFSRPVLIKMAKRDAYGSYL